MDDDGRYAGITGDYILVATVDELVRKARIEEREQYQGRRDGMMRALTEELLHVRTKTLSDLRAQVEALPVWVVERRTAPMTAKERVGAVLLKDVLALFDGGSDE